VASNWKIKPVRDAKYLAFIRQQPCVICGAPHAVPHHVYTNGMGTKCNDTDTLPTCVYCHHMIHDEYTKSSYWPEEKLKVLLATYQAKYKENHK